MLNYTTSIAYYPIRYFTQLPLRIKRLVFGLFNFKFFPIHNEIATKNPILWFGDLVFLMLDVLGIAEINGLFHNVFIRKNRHLNTQEITLSKSIYINEIEYEYVRVNSKMNRYYRKLCVAYVSFNTINYSESISRATLIHEMAHIYQYQKFGSLYLLRALLAQVKKNTYDYGGVENLQKMMLKGNSIFDFNFEQQAEIIEDYYKIIDGQIETTPLIKGIFSYFYNQFIKDYS